MVKNIQTLFKLFLILLLSLFSWINLTHVEAEESSNISVMEKTFKIILAKYSEKVGDSKKTANCLIALTTNGKQTSYCKYSYLGSELCDPKDGINMAEIKLGNYVKIGANLKTWFKDKTNQELSKEELQFLVNIISTDKQEFSKKQTTQRLSKIIILKKQELSDFKTPEKYKNIPQKEFAWLIHKLIEKLRFLDISLIETLSPEANISLLDDFKTELANAWLGLGILLVFILLGLFLIYQHHKIIAQLSQANSAKLAQGSDLEFELKQQMQSGLEELKQLIVSKQVVMGAESAFIGTNLENAKSNLVAEINLKEQNLTKQTNILSWLQLTLVGKLLACRTQLEQIEKTEQNHKILELLELNNLFKQLDILIAQEFNSDSELWHFLRAMDSGKWLNRLLRAADLLQVYFYDEVQLRPLSQHLASISTFFQTLFLENEIGFIQPKLLETVPDYVAEKYYVYKPHPLLKELVKPQVQAKFKVMSRFVVDIETYGFITQDNPYADIRLVVSSPAEWE